MASNPCFAAFAAAEEIPILHYYGVEVFTMAKRILISALLLKGNKVDVEEFLKDTFPRKQQIILAPYRGGQSFSLNDISYQELEDLSIFKPSCEPHAIVGPHNTDEYNTHRSQRQERLFRLLLRRMPRKTRLIYPQLLILFLIPLPRNPLFKLHLQRRKLPNQILKEKEEW